MLVYCASRSFEIPMDCASRYKSDALQKYVLIRVQVVRVSYEYYSSSSTVITVHVRIHTVLEFPNYQ